ncbi:hypothetical protein FCU42_15150 [Vibrio parahaemolyticus]|nr:hypothetical protein [Vibrio parahaemolyticus]
MTIKFLLRKATTPSPPDVTRDGIQSIISILPLNKFNARLSGEQRYHDTQLLHRKHKNQIKLKPPSVANPS